MWWTLRAAVAGRDYDGDGAQDLVTWAHEQDGPIVPMDALYVIDGSPTGLSTEHQWFVEGFSGLPDPDPGSGSTLLRATSGDFDGDGYDDLAAANESEGVSGHPAAGVVHVLYGASAGLTAEQVLSPDALGMLGSSTTDGRFGLSLAAGDFDCDGYDDLAVGMQSGSAGPTSAGMVQVVYGSASGLSTRNDLLDRSTPYVPGIPIGGGELWGGELAAGNFDALGCDDLVVGYGWGLLYPGDRGLTVLAGHPGTGLLPQSLLDALDWTASDFGYSGDEVLLGSHLEVGDTDGDGTPDLVTEMGMTGLPPHEMSDLWVLRGGYLGGFSPWDAARLSPNVRPLGASHFEDYDVGEVTGDGRDDVVTTSVVGSTARVGVWVGGPAFGWPTTFDPVTCPLRSVSSHYRRVTALDSDGDGRAELALGESVVGVEGSVLELDWAAGLGAAPTCARLTELDLGQEPHPHEMFGSASF